jgi:PleD family two-component response regulator
VATAPEDGTTAAELLRAADARLYRAKAAGRNRVVA